MLSLNIDNPTVEDFFAKECNNDESKFINSIVHYIEIYSIKKSVKKGLEEAKLQSQGKLEKREFKDILNEI